MGELFQPAYAAFRLKNLTVSFLRYAVYLLSATLELKRLIASSEESMGEFRFGKCAEIVIECGFVGLLGAESVGFSGDHF